jgi:hypothetical protein
VVFLVNIQEDPAHQHFAIRRESFTVVRNR